MKLLRIFYSCVTLFISINTVSADVSCQNCDYSSAIQAAQKAFLIQTGFQKDLDSFDKYMENKALGYIDDLGIKYELGVGAYLYHIYRTQTIEFPIKPFKLTVTPNSFSANVTFDVTRIF